MLRGEDVMKVRELFDKGLFKTQIANKLGIDRKTVARILAEGPTRQYRRTKQPSKLDPFKDYIRRRVTVDGVTNAQVILREIRQRGYQGGVTILKEFMHPLRPPKPTKFTIRYETEPGEEAQVDWSYFGTHVVFGAQRKLWCFAMVLSWSRMLYIEFVWETGEAMLQRCHVHAFEYFGGVPRSIVYDNMKTVAIGRLENGQVQWNTQFLDFAQYYGFRPRTHRPYRAQTKGKIERPMGYIKGNFFQGIRFESLGDLNSQARQWLDQVANVRVHGTTHEIPMVRWQERERHALRPLTVPPYDTSIVSRRKVSRDGYVVVRTNRYSVPWNYAGQWVTVRETPGGQLEILDGNQLITTHWLLPESARFRPVLQPAHHEVPQSETKSAATAPAVPEVEERPLAVYEEIALGRGSR